MAIANTTSLDPGSSSANGRERFRAGCIWSTYLSQRPQPYWAKVKNLFILLTGSTISTLLHDRINPKDCQVLSLGDTGFLQFFRVVSRDYGKPRLMVQKSGEKTTWDAQKPVNNGMFTIWTGARFLPSTVAGLISLGKAFVNLDFTHQLGPTWLLWGTGCSRGIVVGALWMGCWVLLRTQKYVRCG